MIALDQIKNEGSRDGAVLDQPCSKSKGKRKAANRPTKFFVENCHEHPKPLNCFSNVSKSKRRSVNSAASISKRWLQVSATLLADSPRDNPTHVKEGYLMTVIGGLPSFHSVNQNRKRSTIVPFQN